MLTGRKILSAVLLVLVLAALAYLPLAAQESRTAEFGDPPIASLITISEPDDSGVVTITGAPGAVFPGAVLAVRNMYTGETIYPRAEVTGAFVAQLYGPGRTPFWISPARRIDAAEQNRPGSLPGGPGVILYGPPSVPGTLFPALPAPEGPTTPIRLDGDATDWVELTAPYPVDLGEGRGGLVYALANRESLYLALTPQDAAQALRDDYERLTISLEVDERRFNVVLDPRRRDSGRLFEVAAEGVETDLGPLGGLSIQDAAIELRLPRLAFTGAFAPIAVRGLRFDYGPDSAAVIDLFLLAEEVDESDSRTVDPLPMPDDAVPFVVSGPLGGGSGRWQARGHVSSQMLAPGDSLLLEMQVVMAAPQMPGDGTDLRLGASLRLEPVIAASGAQTVAARAAGNGWGGVLTPTGLAVENVAGDVRLGEVGAQGLIVDGESGTLTFTLQWALTLDDDLLPGLYVPVVDGFAAVTGVTGTWADSGVLGSGPGAGIAETRLPLALQIGDVPDRRLLWTLFQDTPSASGARGVLAQEDADAVALSDRVAFPAARYVLPRTDPATGEPISYALEPYLPAMLGNSFFETVPPLLQFDFASGELSVTVTRPDGSTDDLGTVPLAQNQLSTASQNEAEALGATSPLDVYRLTTLDPRFTAYTFEQDGRHLITVTGTVRDVWGSSYTGGGTYVVWLAEPLTLLPGVLPGTPFEVGDAFIPSLTIAPAFPADVSIRLQVFPLTGGEPITYEVEGTANAHGYFHPGLESDPWLLDTPGEYVVDYTATYTDPFGRLWTGSVRGAGVIATPEGTLVARGGRWLANSPADDRLAWYALDHAAPDVLQANPDAHLRWPYHSGDVLWSRDGTGSIQAGLRLTDAAGAYESWLAAHLPDWQADDGLTARELANEDELPLVTLGPAESRIGPALQPDAIVNEARAYISAVRPGIAVRQFVLGDETPGLVTPGWNFDDPYNYQHGVGVNGDLPGDYTFLFGGAVVHNTALDLHETAIYGALAVVIDPEDERGDRVYPPLRGAANGPDGGPLLTVPGQVDAMFFVPTGFRPGQVFTVGETLALAGQVAPTLPAQVEADVITPAGITLPIIGRANAIGYFHDPAQNLPLDEPGIWRIRVRVSYDGLTSAGRVQPPYPAGGVPGAAADEFFIYVLPEDAAALVLESPLQAETLITPAFPFNVTAAIPADWQDVQAAVTVNLPGVIVANAVQPAPGDVFTYTYDPRRLSQTYPNIDLTVGATQNPLSADMVTVTLVLTGTDADGDPVMAARTLTLFGDRLLALYDGWPVPEEGGNS